MKSVDLYLVLVGYVFTFSAAAVACAYRHRNVGSWVLAGVAIALIPLNTYVGGRIDPNLDSLGLLRYLVRERDLSSLIAVAMGVAAAYAWIPRCTATHDNPTGSTGKRWQTACLALSAVVVVGTGQAFLWKEILGITRHPFKMLCDGFELEQIASLDEQPLRLAVNEENGDVFVCYDYFKKHGAIGGAILRLHQDQSGKFAFRTAVEAPFLIRPYGLAVRSGDLYVSRAGFFPQTQLGTVTYASTGAITQLKDLDGDGYFEYSHDVVTGLPGVRAPDTMQQNNGLAFGADGSLFVTNAGAADRTLDEHVWGGTILRFSPDFLNTEVFAKGFRNPWGIVFGPDAELFVTDSDVDENPGDEINHVIRGGHYGHPFVVPQEADVTSIGFQEPLLVGERETVYLGITYVTSAAFPEEYRNCLYVTDFRQDRILRIRLEKQEATYRVVAVDPFASIPSPVDIASTPAGELIVISRRAQKVYRIRPTTFVEK